MNDYCLSCSSSRVALIAIKEMVRKMINNSHHFNSLKSKCHYCNKMLLDYSIKLLMNAHFNITTNNFTLLLNRRNAANRMTMKMVKDRKNKGSYVNMFKNKNDEENVSTWTCEHSQSFLKSKKVFQKGNRSEFHARCELSKKLLSHDLEDLMLLSKQEL